MKRLNPLLRVVVFLFACVAILFAQTGVFAAGDDDTALIDEAVKRQAAETAAENDPKSSSYRNDADRASDAATGERVLAEFEEQSRLDAAAAAAADSNAANGAATSGASKKTELNSPSYKFNPNTISPSTKTYNRGNSEASGQGNVAELVNRLVQFLLVVVSTGAVLFIIVGGLLMVTSGGDTERAGKGKTIITYNIMALGIAMCSYGILQFVIWVIGG